MQDKLIYIIMLILMCLMLLMFMELCHILLQILETSFSAQYQAGIQIILYLSVIILHCFLMPLLWGWDVMALRWLRWDSPNRSDFSRGR